MTSPRRSGVRRSSRTYAGRAGVADQPTTTANSNGCATTCVNTRATPAPTGKTTPGGPSGRWRLAKDTDALRAKVASRTGSLARMFDQVCAMLRKRGYLTATGPGAGRRRSRRHARRRMLARIWTESDLLVAECIRRGVWANLSPAELAGAVSTVVFEARRDTEERAPIPYGAISDAIGRDPGTVERDFDRGGGPRSRTDP